MVVNVLLLLQVMIMMSMSMFIMTMISLYLERVGPVSQFRKLYMTSS